MLGLVLTTLAGGYTTAGLDAYVIVRFNGYAAQSATIKSKNPAWFHEFWVPVLARTLAPTPNPNPNPTPNPTPTPNPHPNPTPTPSQVPVLAPSCGQLVTIEVMDRDRVGRDDVIDTLTL